MWNCSRYGGCSAMRNWPARMRVLACAGGLALCLATRVTAADAPKSLVPGTTQISEVRLIHADSMAVTQKPAEPQVFQGHVDVIVVDRDRREARLKATKVTIFTIPGSRQVDRIIAEGGVVMVREGLTAKTELAVYDGRQGTVDLLQENYVEDARGQLTADRIRIYLETNQVSAEGNVRGIVFPQQLNESDHDE